jgi:hypothetical protein
VLSLDRCRQLLGQDVEVTPRELERLREQLYALARFAIQEAATHKAERRVEKGRPV